MAATIGPNLFSTGAYEGTMSDDYELNTKQLDQLLKALKTNMKRVRVGILGGKVARSSSYANNATIGAFHEFGTAKMPMRSFLRMPISEHMQAALEKAGAFTKDAAKQVLKEASLGPWLDRVGALAVGVVMDAFDTAGFGKWPKWSKGYSNNTGQILVDTQQLRNSITSEVK